MSIVPVFDAASPQARAIVDLFDLVLGVCGAILCIVGGLIGWSLLRFRGGAGVPGGEASAGH